MQVLYLSDELYKVQNKLFTLTRMRLTQSWISSWPSEHHLKASAGHRLQPSVRQSNIMNGCKIDAKPERHDHERLLAMSLTTQSGDRFHELPISSCGLHLDDEAVRFQSINQSINQSVNL